ncbi:hypothetical protein Tco_0447776 [Tanacetum coccineum]
MESQSETTQTVYALKLPVIVNGDAPTIASASTKGPIPPKTAEQKLARKNELKAKSTLLLAIPDEHQLKFHGIKDAKTLWEAIKTKFGSNKESKKMQKTILKQQNENFTASRFEGLDKTYDRFQKLISQLEIHGEVISQEDANIKLLRSLPLAWNNIALIMRNKSDLDTMSMDDLRGHFARECKAPQNQENRNGDVPRRIVPVETPTNALVVQDGIGSSSSSSSDSENKPSYAKINFVKSNENTRKFVIEQNTYRQAENLRNSQSPRVDKRNWNGLMTQKLGGSFEFNKKACFVCGCLNHLIKDCNFYENKMVGKSMLNNMGRVTGQREVRPLWNNAQRVNHQNKLTHPHPKRNFVPTTVLTKSGNVLVNTAKQSSSRAVVSNRTLPE